MHFINKIYNRIKNKYDRFEQINFKLYESKFLDRKAIDYRVENPPWWLNYKKFQDNVPVTSYAGKGLYINPSFVCYYGFICLANFEENFQEKYKLEVKNAADWLVKNSETIGNTLVWPNKFDWDVGEAKCIAPFVDGMTHSLAISLLVCAYKLFDDINYLKTCKKAVSIYFDTSLKGTFITYDLDGVGPFFEEYPFEPYSRILDGLIIACFGLYDYSKLTGNQDALNSFHEAVDAINIKISEYSFFSIWLYFGGKNYHELCDGAYNSYNIVLIKVLSICSNNQSLEEFSDKLNKVRKLSYVRLLVPILATFVARKNQLNKLLKLNYVRKFFSKNR